MKIGIADLFASNKSGDSYITTTFLVLGLPLVPIKSYFVYNKIKELGSCQIPLNGKNILKNYLAIVLGFMALFFGVMYFIAGEMLLTRDLNPYYHKMVRQGVPLSSIELFLILLFALLAVYFGFFFDTISEEEKQERELFLKSEFATRPFPHQGYIPLAYRYLKTESLYKMQTQLLYVLFAVAEKVSEKEKHLLNSEDMVERIDFLTNKWRMFLQSKSYIGKPAETLALCFIILCIERKNNAEEYDSFNYDNIKRMLLA
jgi:hypothetical protein